MELAVGTLAPFTMDVKVKKLSENAKMPTPGSDYAAGYDIYADTKEMITIQPHSTYMIGTGIAIEIPTGSFIGIFARSGLASKSGLRPANCVGIVDSDYRGEVKVALHNDTDMPCVIEAHERIAQMVLMPFIPMDFVEVDELNETVRGDGGFGSTGNK